METTAEYFTTISLSDIVTYALMGVSAIVYMVNLFKGKTSSVTLQDSLKAFVKNSMVTQHEDLSGVLNTFKDTSFRQLADEIVYLKDIIVELKKSTKDATEADKELVTKQNAIIKDLTEDLTQVKHTLLMLEQRITTEAETNQKRFQKLKKGM